MTSITVRVPGSRPRRAPLPHLPEPRPAHLNCLCPGCYFIATEGEMCLRCTYDGCSNTENHHA